MRGRGKDHGRKKMRKVSNLSPKQLDMLLCALVPPDGKGVERYGWGKF